MTRFRNFIHRLEVQTLSGTTSAGTRGQSQKTWNRVESVQGSVRQLSGDELTQAREVYAQATYEVETHYSTGITDEARFKLGDRVFHILAVDNVEERNRVLRVTCGEKVST